MCGDLPCFEPLNVAPDEERSFVLQVQPCQFEQVGIDPIAHDVIVGRREGLFDARNRRKRPEMDRRRAANRVAQMCDGRDWRRSVTSSGSFAVRPRPLTGRFANLTEIRPISSWTAVSRLK